MSNSSRRYRRHGVKVESVAEWNTRVRGYGWRGLRWLAYAVAILAFAVLCSYLIVPAHAQRTTNTFNVYDFRLSAASQTVGDMTTAAQAQCNANSAYNCVIVFDPILGLFPQGNMPQRCANCAWVDYRTPGSFTVAPNQPKYFSNIRYADQYAGADMGAKINAAYADAPFFDCNIQFPPNAGSTWQFSTPIVFNTRDKLCKLSGMSPTGSPQFAQFSGAILEYTPTTNSCAITLDYADQASIGSGWSSGHGLYNFGLWNNHSMKIGGPGTGSSASGICIGATNSGAGGAEFRNLLVAGFNRGFDDHLTSQSWQFEISNSNFAYNNFGLYFGSSEEGLTLLGGKSIFNGVGLRITGASVFAHAHTYGVHWDSNTVAGILNDGTGGSNIQVDSGHAENCCGNISLTLNSASVAANIATYVCSQDCSGWIVGDSLTISGFSGADTFFNQTCTVTAVSAGVGGSFSCALTHANASSTTTGSVAGKTTAHYFDMGNATLNISGVDMIDDQGSGTEDWWIRTSGKFNVRATIGTAGRSPTSVILGGNGFAEWLTNTANISPCPNFASSTVCAEAPNAGGTPYVTIPVVNLGTSVNSKIVMRGGATPSCSFASGGGTGPSCALGTGSTDTSGTLQLTTGTAPGSSGTVTLTYAASFTTTTNGSGGALRSSCVFTLSNAGGNSWNARATAIDQSSTASADTLSWDNNAVALTASVGYQINYWCPGR